MKKNVFIRLIKHDLGEKKKIKKTPTEFTSLRAKTFSFLTDDNDENKKSKSHKNSFS